MIRTVESIQREIESFQKEIKKLEQTKENLKKLSEVYPDICLDNTVFCSAQVNKDFQKVSISTVGRTVTVSPYCVVDGVKVFSNPRIFELAHKMYDYNYGYHRQGYTGGKSEIRLSNLEELKKNFNLNEDIFSHKKVKMALISFIKKNEGVKIVNLKDNPYLAFLALYL